MREVCLTIPKWDADDNLEIEVRVNGKKRKLVYRVEIIGWDDTATSSEDKIEYLRRVVRNYDKEWKLVQIGNPENGKIPIMFKYSNNDVADE